MSEFDLLPILSAIALYPACWRLAYMLTAERGPANIFTRLRARTDLWGVLKCHACTSMWTALLFVLLWATGWGQWAVLWFGVSGLAVLRGNYLFGAIIVEEPEHEGPKEVVRKGSQTVWKMGDE